MVTICLAFYVNNFCHQLTCKILIWKFAGKERVGGGVVVEDGEGTYPCLYSSCGFHYPGKQAGRNQ